MKHRIHRTYRVRLKMFVLFKFRDHSKLNLVLIVPPRPQLHFRAYGALKVL